MHMHVHLCQISQVHRWPCVYVYACTCIRMHIYSSNKGFEHDSALVIMGVKAQSEEMGEYERG